MLMNGFFFNQGLLMLFRSGQEPKPSAWSRETLDRLGAAPVRLWSTSYDPRVVRDEIAIIDLQAAKAVPGRTGAPETPDAE
jgi:hypothetical protein